MDTEVGGVEEEEGSSNDKGSQTEPRMISSEKEIQTEVFDSRKCMWLSIAYLILSKQAQLSHSE
jgi:hypothetical protein